MYFRKKLQEMQWEIATSREQIEKADKDEDHETGLFLNCKCKMVP
jgi:hypothetical protein